MVATKDQALTVHTRKKYKNKEKKENYHHNKKNKKQKKIKRDPSNVRCYTCDVKGHFARYCPIWKKRHHSHVARNHEPTNKLFRREKDDLDEEYVLISALTSGTISHGRNDWLVDSGASKHVTRYKESFINMFEHESPHKVKHGYDYQYPIKRGGLSFIQYRLWEILKDEGCVICSRF